MQKNPRVDENLTLHEFIEMSDRGRCGGIPDRVGPMIIHGWMRHLRTGLHFDVEIGGQRHADVDTNQAYGLLMDYLRAQRAGKDRKAKRATYMGRPRLTR